MTEVIAIAALALLFVVFGMFVRARHGCPGPESCAESDGHSGCGGCSLRTHSTEHHDA